MLVAYGVVSQFRPIDRISSELRAGHRPCVDLCGGDRILRSQCPLAGDVRRRVATSDVSARLTSPFPCSRRWYVVRIVEDHDRPSGQLLVASRRRLLGILREVGNDRAL